MDIRRAVVSGGAGFIGSHVVDKMIERGAEVLVIDDLSTGSIENISPALEIASERIIHLELSVCEKQAQSAVIDFKPEAVFHFAAQMNVRKSVEEPDFDAQSNVVGTVALAEASQKAGAKKFVFSSTGGAIYGEQTSFPADESHEINPKSPYGVGKRAGELYLQYYAQNTALQAISLRLANVYGPRQNSKGEAGVVAIFCERMLAGQQLTINGTGEQTRDFVYVDDVVSACLAACDKDLESRYGVFNVGLGVETSVNDIAAGLKKALGEELGQEAADSVEIVSGPALPGEQMRSSIDPSALKAALSWLPEVNLEDGLRRTLKSFRK